MAQDLIEFHLPVFLFLIFSVFCSFDYPGVLKSITGPDLIESHLHSFFSLAINCLRSPKKYSFLVAAQTKEKGSEQKQTDDYINIIHQCGVGAGRRPEPEGNDGEGGGGGQRGRDDEAGRRAAGSVRQS
jgi:hypothetical protein